MHYNKSGSQSPLEKSAERFEWNYANDYLLTVKVLPGSAKVLPTKTLTMG